MSERRVGTDLYGGWIKLYEPTDAHPYYRLDIIDPLTNQRMRRSGGAKREYAIEKAADYARLYRIVEIGDEDQSCPTFDDAFRGWIESKRSSWSGRTPDNYEYLFSTLGDLGKVSVRKLTPSMIGKRAGDALSRGQAVRLKAVIRGTLQHVSQWLSPAYTVEEYASAVKVRGTKGASRSREVLPREIPSLAFVSNLITVCYRTLDSEENVVSTADDSVIDYDMHGDQVFWDGLPSSLVDGHRRGVPAHYKNVEKRWSDETVELRSIYRRLALIFALGAGAGMRIGEVLALRVHHVLDRRLVLRLMRVSEDDLWSSVNEAWSGRIRVEEQASQASKGAIWITKPKSNRVRDVHVSAFLPGYEHAHADLGGRTLVEMSRDEVLSAWVEQGAASPRLLMVDRLVEIIRAWRMSSTAMDDGAAAVLSSVMNTMLFPTRSPARKNKYGEYPVKCDENWTGIISPDPLTSGNYFSASNLASKFTHEVYDYVSQVMDEYPPMNPNVKTRQGWSHHALRHFYASLMIRNGMSLPELSALLGHSNPSFTMSVYVHVMNSADSVSMDFVK